MPTHPLIEANRTNWDESVPIHMASAMYDVEGFKSDSNRLTPTVRFDREELADLDIRGNSLLHLQCLFGLDTLSWARLGAKVTGLDISPKAIAAARGLASELGLEACFIESELYAAPEVLDEQFDIVYTGMGAIIWLPDIRRWGDVVARFLKPGGTFYIREMHPIVMALQSKLDPDRPVLKTAYFETQEPLTDDDPSPGTYSDPYAVMETPSYNWNHALGEVFMALVEAGLNVQSLREHKKVHEPYFGDDWPWAQDEDGLWGLTKNRDRIPLAYSIRATKPAA